MSRLALINDFIDRVADPVHGVIVNEDYAQDVGNNVEFLDQILRDEVERFKAAKDISDREINALTTHGWMWFIPLGPTRTVPAATN